MALLIFPPDNLAPSLAALLDPNLRKTVANKVNDAILINQGARREARLRSLVRLRMWAEQKNRESKKDLPSKLHLGLDLEEGNGGAQDTVMQETDGNDGTGSIR